MTDTASAAPSDAEIDAQWRESVEKHETTAAFVRDFARTVLAKWGAPPQISESDAARYRWLRDEGFTFADVDLGTDSDGDYFVAYRIRFHLPEPAHSKFEDDEWTGPDIDAAIDAARKQGANHD